MSSVEEFWDVVNRMHSVSHTKRKHCGECKVGFKQDIICSKQMPSFVRKYVRDYFGKVWLYESVCPYGCGYYIRMDSRGVCYDNHGQMLGANSWMRLTRFVQRLEAHCSKWHLGK